MMLGDLLGSARRSAGAFGRWLEGSDPGLAGRVSAAAGAEGVSISGFVRRAVSDFSRFATEEDWATLTSAIRGSEEPGTTCLLAMLHWRLTASQCDTHIRRHANGRIGR